MRMARVNIRGQATLTCPGIGSLNGNGSVLQYDSGKIAATVAISGLDNSSLPKIQNLNPTSFTLTCPNGRQLTSTTWLTTNTQFRVGSTAQIVVEGLLTHFTLSPTGGSNAARSFKHRFFITNFQFLGTQPTTTKHGNRTSIRASKLPLDIPGRNIFLDWVRNYEKIVQELKADRQPQVTAVLTLNALAQDTVVTIEELAENICTVMSLASGNHVAWIETRRYGSQGRWLSSIHRASVTRPYVPHSLLDPYDGAGLQNLVRTGLPSLQEWDKKLGTATDLRPLRNAIRLGLDARTESTYLQSRTLAAVTVMELLTSKLMTYRNTTTLVSEDTFSAVKQAVTPALREVLSDASVTDAVFHSMKAKLIELNRVTLRQQLRKLIEEAGVDVDSQELDTYIKVRNSIVHTGDYNKQLKRTPIEQHWTVLEFVDRMLLGLLGYSGKYISALRGWKTAELKSTSSSDTMNKIGARQS